VEGLSSRGPQEAGSRRLTVDAAREGPRVRPLALALLAPLALWAALLIVLPPAAQDFPLSDDWSYAKGALSFARGGGIHYFGWSAIPLLGQWLWSLPFVWLLGESHVSLRISTIVLSALACLAFFDLLRREVRTDARRAAFAAAALGLNPLFFMASGTFLSDVPSLAGALIAAALYSRAFEARTGRFLFSAGLVAGLAIATRQSAVAVSLAALLVLLQDKQLRRRPLFILAVVLPAAAGMAALYWFTARADIQPVSPQLPQPLPALALAFVALHTMGLAALPLLALDPSVRSWRAIGVILAAMAAGFFWLAHGEPFPFLGNILTPWGAMPGTVLGESALVMGSAARLLLTIAGGAGAAWLVSRAMTRGRAVECRPLLALFTLFSFGIMLTSPHVFDRYLLVLLPWALLLGTPSNAEPLHWKTGLAVLAVFGLFSLASMHDWLAWNSARWSLGRRAVASGIAAADIEGGFEWDGWHSPRAAAQKRSGRRRGLMMPFTGGWFPKITGRYALALSQLEGTVHVDAEPYRLWLAPGRREFLLLEKSP